MGEARSDGVAVALGGSSVDVAGEELWCYVCRTHYPHQAVDGETPLAGDAPDAE